MSEERDPERDAALHEHLHDVFGALAVISGQCEMLEQELWGPLTPQQRRSIEAMKRQVDRIRDTAEQMRPPR